MENLGAVHKKSRDYGGFIQGFEQGTGGSMAARAGRWLADLVQESKKNAAPVATVLCERCGNLVGHVRGDARTFCQICESWIEIV